MVGIKAAKAATKVGKIATNGNGILPKTVHQHGVTTHTPMLGTTQVGNYKGSKCGTARKGDQWEEISPPSAWPHDPHNRAN